MRATACRLRTSGEGWVGDHAGTIVTRECSVASQVARIASVEKKRGSVREHHEPALPAPG